MRIYKSTFVKTNTWYTEQFPEYFWKDLLMPYAKISLASSLSFLAAFNIAPVTIKKRYTFMLIYTSSVILTIIKGTTEVIILGKLKIQKKG